MTDRTKQNNGKIKEKPEYPKCGYTAKTAKQVFKHNAKHHPDMINFCILARL